MYLSLRTASLALILAIAAVTILSLSAQAGDPLAGTWELNLTKSKFINAPAPKSETRTYEVTGQQVKMTAKRVKADGQTGNFGYTANPDGKNYPYTGHPIHDTISITPVDALTARYTAMKAGKPVGEGTRVISKDGKTMTISFKGTGPKGQPLEAILVFDKQ